MTTSGHNEKTGQNGRPGPTGCMLYAIDVHLILSEVPEKWSSIPRVKPDLVKKKEVQTDEKGHDLDIIHVENSKTQGLFQRHLGNPCSSGVCLKVITFFGQKVIPLS